LVAINTNKKHTFSKVAFTESWVFMRSSYVRYAVIDDLADGISVVVLRSAKNASPSDSKRINRENGFIMNG
jgi:hypothetical protein